MSSGADELVELGRLNGAWGVAGWVKVFSHTDPPEAIFDYQPWLVGPDRAPLEVTEWRRVGARLMARLHGVESREAADRLGRPHLYVRRDVLPETAPGQYYWHELIGLEVFNLDDHRFGRVSGLLDAGVHDVLVIAGDDKGRETLIPFVMDRFVRVVDLDGGRIVVDWQPDWLDAD